MPTADMPPNGWNPQIIEHIEPAGQSSDYNSIIKDREGKMNRYMEEILKVRDQIFNLRNSKKSEDIERRKKLLDEEAQLLRNIEWENGILKLLKRTKPTTK